MTGDPSPGEQTERTVLAENAAQHAAGPGYEDIREAVRVALRPHGAHHLAHFSGSVYDFDVDIIDSDPPVVSSAPRQVRSRCRRAGRQLSTAIDDLSRDLQEVATGALIRMVVHSDKGAFCCDAIVPGRYVVATVFDHATGGALSSQTLVRACDEAVSELVTEQRGRLSLGSQNPGGYGSPEFESHTQRREPQKIHTTREPGSGVDPQLLAEVEVALTNAVTPDALHYLALCANGVTALSVDCLNHDDVARFFTQISVQDRRSFYVRFGGDVQRLAGRFMRVTAPVIGTRLLRLVLDVEQGAIYYYRLDQGIYLVGVTLDQARVAPADDRMSDLAMHCRSRLQTFEPSSS
jgi:hypothetical protein